MARPKSTPERKREIQEHREKIIALWHRGKTRKEICAELCLSTPEYDNHISYLRKTAKISYVRRDRALIGKVPRLGDVLPNSDGSTSEAAQEIMHLARKHAPAVFGRMRHLAMLGGPEHEVQVKMLGIWKELYLGLFPRQQSGAATNSGLTIVFNGVKRGPKMVQKPAIETTATPVEEEPADEPTEESLDEPMEREA